MLTARELLSLLIRNQDQRYWHAMANGISLEEFYTSPLEIVADRMMQEARIIIANSLVEF